MSLTSPALGYPGTLRLTFQTLRSARWSWKKVGLSSAKRRFFGSPPSLASSSLSQSSLQMPNVSPALWTCVLPQVAEPGPQKHPDGPEPWPQIGLLDQWTLPAGSSSLSSFGLFWSVFLTQAFFPKQGLAPKPTKHQAALPQLHSPLLPPCPLGQAQLVFLPARPSRASSSLRAGLL